MNTEIKKLIRPEILQLRPYQAAQYLPEMVRMNANENPYPPYEDKGVPLLNLYPEAVPTKLRASIANYLDVKVDNCVVTRGSTEAIDLLIRVFCRPQLDEIVIFPPTFEMYQVYAAIQGAKIKTIPLLLNQKFALDLEAFKKKVSPVSKLTFLCSPSNPTGNTFDESTTFEICKTLEGSGLLVFDGAYTEFSSVNYTSELLNEFSNVVVLRTLSKAFALAGSRCGVLLASKEICDYIMRVIPPYSFSVPAEQTVLKGLSKQGIKSSKQNVEKIINERAYLTGKLSELNCVKEVFPSEANFILIKVEDAEVFYKKAKDAGLLVRNVSYQPSLDNCIRVSIGTREQNQQLLEAVQ